MVMSAALETNSCGPTAEELENVAGNDCLRYALQRWNLLIVVFVDIGEKEKGLGGPLLVELINFEK